MNSYSEHLFTYDVIFKTLGIIYIVPCFASNYKVGFDLKTKCYQKNVLQNAKFTIELFTLNLFCSIWHHNTINSHLAHINDKYKENTVPEKSSVSKTTTVSSNRNYHYSEGKDYRM